MKRKRAEGDIEDSLKKLEEIETVKRQIIGYEERKRAIEMHNKRIQDRAALIEQYYQNPKILTLSKCESLKNHLVDHLASKHTQAMQKRLEDFEKSQAQARQEQVRAVQQANFSTMNYVKEQKQKEISKERQPPTVPPMSFIEQDKRLKEQRRVKQMSNREALERQI